MDNTTCIAKVDAGGNDVERIDGVAVREQYLKSPMSMPMSKCAMQEQRCRLVKSHQSPHGDG